MGKVIAPYDANLQLGYPVLVLDLESSLSFLFVIGPSILCLGEDQDVFPCRINYLPVAWKNRRLTFGHNPETHFDIAYQVEQSYPSLANN